MRFDNPQMLKRSLSLTCFHTLLFWSLNLFDYYYYLSLSFSFNLSLSLSRFFSLSLSRSVTLCRCFAILCVQFCCHSIRLFLFSLVIRSSSPNLKSSPVFISHAPQNTNIRYSSYSIRTVVGRQSFSFRSYFGLRLITECRRRDSTCSCVDE